MACIRAATARFSLSCVGSTRTLIPSTLPGGVDTPTFQGFHFFCTFCCSVCIASCALWALWVPWAPWVAECVVNVYKSVRAIYFQECQWRAAIDRLLPRSPSPLSRTMCRRLLPACGFLWLCAASGTCSRTLPGTGPVVWTLRRRVR